MQRGNWCTKLKLNAISQMGLNGDTCVQYLGIAADEPERIARYIDRPGYRLPLVELGWDEAYCREWCEKHGLLSPTYETATRGDVGFATTKVLTSSGNFGETILSCGHCC